MPRHLAATLTAEEDSINKAIYTCVFDDIYRKHASITRLEEVYRLRWCKQHMLNVPQPRKLADNAARQLRWISKRLPPRVQIACVRFHFNGWHTGRRYQKRDSTQCLFCKLAVHDLFPNALKTDAANRVPVKHFFLLGLDGRHRLTFALILYALFAVHNDFRHSKNHTDFKTRVFQTVFDTNINPSIRRAVLDILGLRP